MNVMNHLNTLEASGLVRLAQVVPDLEYLFRHNLVQDAAYASLLDQDQQRLHQAVGEALETLYADHLDEMAAELAHHFEQAGDHGRALYYFKKAAQAALPCNLPGRLPGSPGGSRLRRPGARRRRAPGRSAPALSSLGSGARND